jgi:hypothetical protein
VFAAYVPTAHTYVHSLFGFLLDKYVLGKMHFPRKPHKNTKRTFPAFSAPGFSFSATSDVSWPRHGKDKRKDVGGYIYK